jgi:IPT/TIG domain
MARFRAAGAGIATVSLVVASVLAGSAIALAGPANDDFGNAAEVTGSNWSTTVSTVGASTEASEPTGTGDAATVRTSSVWLSWTAPATSTVTVSASSDDVATVGLAVFQGESVGSLKQKAFSTDGVLSDVSVKKDQTYQIQVSGIADLGADSSGSISVGLATAPAPAVREEPPARDTSSGPGGTKVVRTPGAIPNLDPAAPPSNDNYSSAKHVVGASWYSAADNTSATTQSGENIGLDFEITGYSVYHTLWFKWTAPASGSVTVSTDGSSVDDTAIAIFTGSSLSHSSRKAWNDQQSGLSGSNLSQINSFKVSKGTTYYIQAGSSGTSLSDANSDLGLIIVNLVGHYSAPMYDNLASALVKTGTSWSATMSDVGATIESESGTDFEPTANPDAPSFPRLGSNWIKWKPSATGTITVNTNNSSDKDTYLAIFDQDKYGDMSELDFDDESGVDSWSQLTGVNVYTQHTYFIQVGLVHATPFNPFDVFGDGFYDTGSVKVNFAATYVGPTVTSVSPSSGRLSGGKTVKIYGARLNGAFGVKFGDNNAAIVDATHSSYVVVTTPAGDAKKKYKVTVTTSSGTSLIVTASHYTYT